jgi:hypothetical protein
MEEFQYLGGRIEAELPGFLPQRKGSYPDRDEPVLAERQTDVWMGHEMKKQLAVASAMDHLAGRRTAQREPAQDEWPGMESKFLAAAGPLLADETAR